MTKELKSYLPVTSYLPKSWTLTDVTLPKPTCFAWLLMGRVGVGWLCQNTLEGACQDQPRHKERSICRSLPLKTSSYHKFDSTTCPLPH